MWCYFSVAPICISLVANDSDHPFLCLFAACVPWYPLPWRCVLSPLLSFAHFLTGLLAAHCWGLSSSYVPVASHLSSRWFAHIFSYLASSLFILLKGSFTEQRFFHFAEVILLLWILLLLSNSWREFLEFLLWISRLRTQRCLCGLAQWVKDPVWPWAVV